MAAKTKRVTRSQQAIPRTKENRANVTPPKAGFRANTGDRFWSREDAHAVAVLLGITVFYFFPAFLYGNSRVLSSIWNDTWNQYFYWREFGFGALRHGQLPLWNPYIFSGTPFIAGTQSAIFYPLNFIYLFLDTALAINVSIALHCFLAAFFTYIYCRYVGLTATGALLSGITFAFGAPFFLHIFAGHLSNLSTMPWLPLLFLSIEAFLRYGKLKYSLLGAVALAIQAFAGHPQYLFYSVVAVGLYFAIGLFLRVERHDMPRSIGGFLLLVAGGIALAAVQLLPALELTRYSVREALSYQWVSTFSLPPENLLTAFFPNFFGDFLAVPYWGRNNLWESSLYHGVVPMVLVVFALFCDRDRDVKVLAAIALASFVVAVGKHTPLLWILYHYVPGFSLFRGVSKFIFVYSFAFAVIAGHGIDALPHWARMQARKSTRLGYGLLLTAGFLIVVALIIQGAGQTWQQWTEAYINSSPPDTPLPALSSDFFTLTKNIAVQTILRAAAFTFLFGALLLLFIKAKTILAKHITVALIVLAGLDLWSFGKGYLVTFDPSKLKMDPEVKGLLKKDSNPYRWTIPKLPDVNMGMIEGLENAGGYDAIVLKNYSDLVNAALGLPIDQPNMVMGIATVSRIFDMLNVRYYLIDAARQYGDPTLTMIFHNERYKVYRNAKALPRSFIVHETKVATDREAALGAIMSPEFNPAAFAIVSEPLGFASHSTARSPTPVITRRGLNEVVIWADPSAPGLLVLSDSFYPGWKAFVDGKGTEIHRVNYVMRGVVLSPGNHEVVFRYDPLSFKVGALISATSVILLVAFLFWTRLSRTAQRWGA